MKREIITTSETKEVILRTITTDSREVIDITPEPVAPAYHAWAGLGYASPCQDPGRTLAELHSHTSPRCTCGVKLKNIRLEGGYARECPGCGLIASIMTRH